MSKKSKGKFQIAVLCLVCLCSSRALAADRKSDPGDEWIYRTYVPFYPPPEFSEEKAAKEIVEHSDNTGMVTARTMVQASQKDKRALSKILQQFSPFTGGASIDEGHGSFLLGLLIRWGDRDFAAVLSQQSPETKKSMLEHLIYEPWKKSQSKLFSQIFPLTFKACQGRVE